MIGFRHPSRLAVSKTTYHYKYFKHVAVCSETTVDSELKRYETSASVQGLEHIEEHLRYAYRRIKTHSTAVPLALAIAISYWRL